MIRKTILGVLAGALLSSSALAQITVPQVGVNQANVREQTYSAVSVALVPAASATDVFCISVTWSER